MRLAVAERWITPSSVLDVGAHEGGWTAEARQVWPTARYLLIEGNPACSSLLDASGEEWRLALLSAERGVATFWLPVAGINTGASLYRERTPYFADDRCTGVKCLTTTLDEELAGQTFDLIKLDVQGAELDVLRGGPATLAAARGVIVEVSLVPYNDGAPLAGEVDAYLRAAGFVEVAALAESRGVVGDDGLVRPGDATVIQRDLLYLREEAVPRRLCRRVGRRNRT